jgi:hypothetical protein
MASITCRCGTVKLQFPSNTPRVSTECCCNHCFARVKYLEDLGGPKVPSKPLLASKWDNKVKIISGRDKLQVYKMTSETMVTNISSTCCHTFLLGRHPGYDANCVTTSSDFPVFKDAENIVAASRWYPNQWDKDRLSKYDDDDKLIGIWVQEEDGSIVGEDGWEDVFKAQIESMEREIPEGAEGQTFDQIIDSVGRDNIKIVSGETSDQSSPK